MHCLGPFLEAPLIEIAASLCSSQRRLDCGNPHCGFARLRCPDCQAEHLLIFSCRTRGFCPSCHAKRIEEWGEWINLHPHLHFLVTAGGVKEAGLCSRPDSTFTAGSGPRQRKPLP